MSFFNRNRSILLRVFDFSDKTISPARNCLYKFLIAQRPAEQRNRVVDVSFLDKRIFPDGVEQIFAGNDITGISSKQY